MRLLHLAGRYGASHLSIVGALKRKHCTSSQDTRNVAKILKCRVLFVHGKSGFCGPKIDP